MTTIPASEFILKQQVTYMLNDLSELSVNHTLQVVQHFFGLKGCRIAREVLEEQADV
jgi:hypothetical protein